MQSDLNCPLCEQQYSNENPARLLINCGHSFCEKCIKKIITEKKGSYKLVCPEDGEMVTLKDSNVNNFPKNIALLKIIQAKKASLEFKDVSLQVSKIIKNEQPQQDQDTRDLVASIISPNNTISQENIKMENKDEQQKQIIQKQVNKKQKKEEIQQQPKPKIELCPSHQKPLQVVCVIDLKKICSSCAIFGEHRGHEFKSIDQIEKQRVDYYHSILNIMDKKENVSERISSEQTCTSIMEILSKKKQTMKKSITQKYTKLISTVQAKQKQSMKNLENVILKTQSKLKALMKIDSNTLNKYDHWQQKSYREIKILEGKDFQAKLQLLFVGASNEADVLEQGDAIIQQMYKQQQNLINEVQQALENIGVDFNLEIFNHIDNFVELYDEKKKKKARVSKSQTQNPTSNVLPSNINKTSSIAPKRHQKKQQLPSITIIPSINSTEELKIPQTILRPPSTIEESLLEMLDQVQVKKIINQPKFQQIIPRSLKQTPQKKQINIQNFELNFNISEKKSQKMETNKKDLQKSKSPQLTQRSLKDTSFLKQKGEKPNKKKLAKIKIPEKYQKMLDSLAHDQAQCVDFTNAELGDATIVQICQYINGSKAKTVKLIRNKLSDEVISKIVPYMKGVITLNLSQNLLTQRTLDIIHDMRQYLPSLKSLILSQNKIIDRKHKAKIDKVKALEINLSV